METSKEIVGKNIKFLRKRIGLTQEQLGKYLSISHEEVSYFENGKRAIPTKLMTLAADLFCVDEYSFYDENLENEGAKIAFAFRAENLAAEDLNSIASFKKIVKNYIKMKKVLTNV